MMSCFVESAEAISSGIFLSFWSVWTLKVAMKMTFFPFIGLELTFFVLVALVSVVDFDCNLKRHYRTRSLVERATSDAG